MLYVCVYPFAMNLALYRSMDPSTLYLMEKTHLHPIALFPLGSATSKCYFSIEHPILPLLLEPILDLIRPPQCSWEYDTRIVDAQMP